MIIIFAVDSCQVRADLLGKLLLKISQLLPSSPYQFKIAFLVDSINATTPWGLGGVITELLSGVIEFIKLVIAWKIVKLLISTLASRL